MNIYSQFMKKLLRNIVRETCWKEVCWRADETSSEANLQSPGMATRPNSGSIWSRFRMILNPILAVQRQPMTLACCSLAYVIWWLDGRTSKFPYCHVAHNTTSYTYTRYEFGFRTIERAVVKLKYASFNLIWRHFVVFVCQFAQSIAKHNHEEWLKGFLYIQI